MSTFYPDAVLFLLSARANLCSPIAARAFHTVAVEMPRRDSHEPVHARKSALLKTMLESSVCVFRNNGVYKGEYTAVIILISLFHHSLFA